MQRRGDLLEYGQLQLATGLKRLRLRRGSNFGVRLVRCGHPGAGDGSGSEEQQTNKRFSDRELFHLRVLFQ